MQSYPQSGGLYPQARPDWANYGQPGQVHHAHMYPPTPTSAAPHGRPAQVYSFVPIPGAQQHKRPRRRYEEIERMYKCGWNGCEKAYGTLNHLNAHVTMQSHGQKRTPEEFKEIRKEWKARKKQEEADRKAADEADRQRAVQEATHNGGSADASAGQAAQAYGSSLPPIRYQPTGQSAYPAPPSTTAVPQQPLPEYASPSNSGYPSQYMPASPYAPPPGQQQMYSQRQ
ncbi:homocitrate synthase lys21 [Pestalotiopsis sp. IQ-011]